MERIRVAGKKKLGISADSSIVLEDGAEAEISIRPGRKIQILIKTGKRCSVQTYMIVESRSSVSQENHIGEGSRIKTSSLWLSGGEGRMLNLLEGKGASAYDLHLFSGRHDDGLKVSATLRHLAKDTKGDVLVKGVVSDRSSAFLDGLIKIDKKGAGAESFLSEHVMILGKDAHARADPKLEIENNDVSSRHSASVSQIDPDKMFYLASRGIGAKEAEKLIVEGFLSSGLFRITDDAIRKTFEERLQGSL
ncbi:MAG: SufD family Fe-S cluster assembly protein [Candidatus Micrarchaeota archaeon]